MVFHCRFDWGSDHTVRKSNAMHIIPEEKDIKRPVHPPPYHNFYFPSAFSLSRLIPAITNFAEMQNRDAWWTQTSSGIRLPRATSEQASHSSSCCCVLAPVDYGCHPKSEHVSVSYLGAHCFYIAGNPLLVWRHCGGGVIVFTQKSHADFWPAFAYRTVFWHFLSNIEPCS